MSNKLNKKGDDVMKFTKKELAVLNQMISIALLSGQIEFSEEAKSVHQKISNEILQREVKSDYRNK